MDVCIYLFRLIDPQTQVTRLRVRWSLFLCLDGLRVGHVFQWISSVLLLSLLLQFPLSTVLQCSSHQDNKRLFGFILQSAGGRGDSRIVCYIFESNNDGEKVVCVCSSVCLAVWHRLDCLTCLSSSCVSDLRQHRSGQADSLPLWDGETDVFKTLLYWKLTLRYLQVLLWKVAYFCHLVVVSVV